MSTAAKLLDIFDELEKRVEELRHRCSILRDEKDMLVECLKKFECYPDLHLLCDDEREEIFLIRDRLLRRATTVDVTVLTPRTENQLLALEAVNKVVDLLLVNFREAETRTQCERFYNSCISDATGPVDDRFQKMILECAAEDQRKIREKLSDMLKKLQEEQATS